MYDYFLFDLDGTLTDPGIGITNSVMHALQKYKIQVKDRTELYRFIGPPLAEGFQEFYGFTPEESSRAITYFREYFTEKGIFENTPYPGIAETLAAMKAAGKKLLVATSKPEPFAGQILEHFDLIRYFDFVGGSLMNETRTQKAEVIAYVLEEVGVTDRSRAIMVGDRRHDVEGAGANGLDCIGVLYGYGSREELTEAGALQLISAPHELLKFI